MVTQHNDWTTEYSWPLTSPNADYRFDAIAHHSSENGLHSIDIALLPQAKLPCKVAIEVDGVSHFLYESYKLDKGPIPTKYGSAG